MSKSSADRYVIKVFLYQIEPQIWRRFSIPADASFEALHLAIQKSMGWKNQQHHEFRHGKGKRLLDVIASPWDDMPQIDNFTDEREITIREFVGRKRTPLRLLYRYDFTDEWIHEVVIESKNTPEKASKKPEMIDGERACPPENAGGAHGYNACLDGTLDWMDDRYDPETFDPKKIKF